MGVAGADHAAADRLHANRIEQLQLQAEMARRRYQEVDPSNRLVAATLEAEWNASLEATAQATAKRDRMAQSRDQVLSEEQAQRIRELARDFGQVWNATTTSQVDRKRMLALLIEDVTLTRENYRATIGLRLPGGKTHTLEIDLPKPSWFNRQHVPRDEPTKLEIKELVDQGHDNRTIAKELNRRGRKDAQGDGFIARRVQDCRAYWKWPSCTQIHHAKLREQGYVSELELATILKVDPTTLRQRAHRDRGIEVNRFTVGLRTFTMYRELSRDPDENQDPDFSCPSDPVMSP